MVLAHSPSFISYHSKLFHSQACYASSIRVFHTFCFLSRTPFYQPFLPSLMPSHPSKINSSHFLRDTSPDFYSRSSYHLYAHTHLFINYVFAFFIALNHKSYYIETYSKSSDKMLFQCSIFSI